MSSRASARSPVSGSVFDPAEWPIAWMARAERQHARNANALLAPHGIQHREFRLLAFLGCAEGLSVNDLAEAAVLERSTVSKMVDRLEQEGWVVRRADASDGRRIELALTASGRRTLRVTGAVVEDLLRRYQHGAGAADRARFMQSVKTFFERVQAAGADPIARPPSGGRQPST